MNVLNKFLTIFLLCFFPILAFSQKSIIWEDFEDYSNGTDYVSANSSSWWNNGGTGGGGIITNSSGTGYNSSNAYLESGDGWNKFQYNFVPTNGETYEFYFWGQITAGYAGNLKLQIFRLNANGTGDDVNLSEVLWNAHVGDGAQNVWKNVSISYTATADDAASANGIAIRMFKTYGTGMKIDDFRVTCTSCPHTSYENGNWSSTSTWGGNGVPPANENTVVDHDITVDASTNDLGTLTINSGKTLTINDGYTVEASSTFDATGATIDMNGNSRLNLSGTVNNLGTLDAAAGTVEYDGGTQNVLADDYYNLEIDQSGVKTSQGTVTAAGTLTVQSGATYAIAGTTTTVTGATDVNGTLTASTGTFDANGSFDATDANVTFTGDGRLQCESTVTSLGTLSTDYGTVEYDGGTQTILADTYHHLEVDQSGTKSSAGVVNTEGDITISAGTFDMNSNNIYCAGNFTNSGTLSAASTVTFYLDGNGSNTNIGAFSDTDINLRKSGSSNITTTGNIDCRGFALQSGSSNSFIIDGESVTVANYCSVEGGTLQITSGSFSATQNYDNTNLYSGFNLRSATIDVDGGTMSFGGTSDNASTLNINGGTLEVSGGILNVSDAIDVVTGTVTQTGGIINLRNYTGSNNRNHDKLEMAAGTLNLTEGTMNINGEGANVDYYSLDIESGVTVNANANHIVSIVDNTSGSSLENRYIDMGGNSLGSLTFNVSSKDLFLKHNTTLLGNLTVTAGEFRPQAYNVDIAGAVDIDDEIEISTGIINVDGAFDASGGTIDFTDAGRITLAGTVSSLGTLDAAAGTVEYDGGAQDVVADDYYNLEIDQSGIKTSQGTITSAGTLTVQTGATFAIAATSTTVTGASDINGALTASTGTYDANSTFDATGGSITFSGAGTISISGAVTSLGTLGTSAGTIDYDGADQTIFSDTYYNLELGGSGTPAAGGNIICNGTFTLQNSTTKYNLSSYTHQTLGASDVNEEIEISIGTYDADGAFDGTGGDIDFTGDGRLQLAGTVTSLGVLDYAAGTVEYDGGAQTVLEDVYYNLEIDQSGIKTSAGGVQTDGDITINSGTSLELAGNALYCAGNFTNSGALNSSSTVTFYLDGNSGSTNFGGFSDSDINIRKTGSSTITTTGNIDCRGFALTSGNSNSFIVDGESVTVANYCSVEAGTLQITSGSFTTTSNNEGTNLYTGMNLNGGTIDIDGGTMSFGETSDNTTDLNINGGTLEVSAGTLNVSDCIDLVDGTLTQTGGIINLRNYNGSDNTGQDKLEMAAGTLNLTAGTMNINGESSSSTNYSIDIASSVTVNANANHIIVLTDNTSGASTENRYIDMGGNNMGSLTHDVSAKNLYFVGSHNILGALSNTLGTVRLDDAAETITVASISQASGGIINISDGELECTGKADIDGKLTISGGTFDVNGELELSSSTTEYITNGNITVAGDFDGANGNNFTPTGGTITLDGSADAGLSIHSSANFYNLTINNSSFDIDALSNVEVDNDFVISSGELDMGSNQLYIKGDISNSGILTTSNSTLTMNGSSAQTISTAINATDMIINNNSGVTANANVTLSGNLTLNASCTYNIGSTTTSVTGTSDINGTLSISTGTYDANGAYDASGGNTTISGAGRLQLGGTVTSLGTPSFHSTSVIAFDGTSAQTIPDISSKSCYPGLEVGGSEKTLAAATCVNNVLSWTSAADIETAGNKLTLNGGNQPTNFGSSDSEAWGNHDNDRIIMSNTGTVEVDYVASGTGEFFIPVGIDGSQRTVAVTPASADNRTWTVKYIAGTPHSGGLDWSTYTTGAPIASAATAAHVNNLYYYDIEPSSSSSATIKLGMVGLSQAPAGNDKTFIMRYDNESGDGDAASNQWEELASPSRGTSGSQYYVSASTSVFSPFGQGSSGAALPIDLVSFDGKCGEGEVELTFNVASQINNDYYTISRSVDNKNWSILTEIAGVDGGNTSTEMSYRWTDYSPLNGMSYYRLTQTDFDGRSEVFAPITVTCRDQQIGDYSVYPNPAKEELMIDLELDDFQGENLKVRLMDINGRVAMEEPITLERGFNHLEMNIDELPKGLYLLQFTGTKSHIKESRIVKQ